MLLLMSPDLLSLNSRGLRRPVAAGAAHFLTCDVTSRAPGAAPCVVETPVKTGNVPQRLGLITRSQDSRIQQNSSASGERPRFHSDGILLLKTKLDHLLNCVSADHGTSHIFPSVSTLNSTPDKYIQFSPPETESSRAPLFHHRAGSLR